MLAGSVRNAPASPINDGVAFVTMLVVAAEIL
jgi:hypothetical protein